MSLETFDFFYVNWSTVYPNEGTQIQYGNSYTFASKPTSPSQRRFKLDMLGIQYFLDENDEILGGDAEIDAPFAYERNAKRLEEFYLAHKQWKSFLFNHPVWGQLEVRFGKPLELPKTVGNGVLGAFNIELLEQP
tara:strand:+ start:230 stop:634 length:405 start_codon:yes stop_codon:yes gene_type:complete